MAGRDVVSTVHFRPNTSALHIPRQFTDLDIISGRFDREGSPFTRAMRGLHGMDPDFLADTISPRRRFGVTERLGNMDFDFPGGMLGMRRDRGMMAPGLLRTLQTLDLRDTRRGIRRTRDAFRNFGRTLVNARPSIMFWWNILALFIPILITLAGAAVGVIAAFSGIAVAAAGIVGIGLLGWGDSAAESFENLRQEARALGSELFDVMRPVSAEFQPIVEGAMGALPSQVQRLRDELMGLSGFAGGLGEIGVGFIDWVETSLQLINKWQDEIIHISLVAGRAFGSLIQDVLVFGLAELIRNQEAYEKLGRIFVDLIRIIFDLSKIVAFTAAQFEPLINIIKQITGFLSNRLAIAFLTFASVAFIGTLAVLELTAALTTAQIAGLGGFLTGIYANITAMWQWVASTWAQVAALSALQKALIATGIGAVAVLAGMAVNELLAGTRPSGRLQGGRSVNNNITIQGDVGRREMHQLKDYYGYPDG